MEVVPQHTQKLEVDWMDGLDSKESLSSKNKKNPAGAFKHELVLLVFFATFYHRKVLYTSTHQRSIPSNPVHLYWLLAPQSGAHRRGALRDPIPSPPAFYCDLWQAVTLQDH